jgi:hypothetical protein
MIPLLALAIAAAGCGSDAAGDEGAEAASTEWTAQVSVEPTEVGPLEVSVGEVSKPRGARPGGSTIHHELTFENAGEREISFENQRSSRFVGEGTGLLVADNGCGYAIDGPGSPIEVGGCRSNLDLIELEPGETESRDVSLFRGLRGMDELEPGEYVFEHPVSFAVGGEEHSAVLWLNYDVSLGT